MKRYRNDPKKPFYQKPTSIGMVVILIVLLSIIYMWNRREKIKPQDTTKQELKVTKEMTVEKKKQTEKNENHDQPPSEEFPKEDAVINKDFNTAKTLKEGETWIVDGNWKLTLQSVIQSDERNDHNKKEPKQLLIIHYTYENLGYEQNGMDLLINPFAIRDEKGNLGFAYNMTLPNYPKEIPIGTTYRTQEAYGVEHPSKTVKIYFEHIDKNEKVQRIIYEVPVMKAK